MSQASLQRYPGYNRTFPESNSCKHYSLICAFGKQDPQVSLCQWTCADRDMVTFTLTWQAFCGCLLLRISQKVSRKQESKYESAIGPMTVYPICCRLKGNTWQKLTWVRVARSPPKVRIILLVQGCTSFSEEPQWSLVSIDEYMKNIAAPIHPIEVNIIA